MSSSTVAHLQALLAQLQALGIQEPNPQLDQQFAAVAALAQTEIQQHRHGVNQTVAPSPATVNDPGSETLAVSAQCSSPESPEPPVDLPPLPPLRFSLKADSRFPFTPIELEGSNPSDAYLDPSRLRQFGTPLTGVLPLEPPLELFVWPVDSISTAGKPDHDKLLPAPAAPKPAIGYFPQAPVYVLNAELDRSYRRGWRYAAPFYTSSREQERKNMLEVRMPPNVTPTHFDLRTRSFVAMPIPGMVRAPLGIPLVHHVDGNPKQAVTVVCAHSLDTLMEYEEGPEIRALVPQLLDFTWGKEKSGDSSAVPGIFELLGLKTNLRSKHIDLTKVQPGDGSFNLASTHGEGEGHGHFAPAVQTDTPEAAAIIKPVLTILHRLYRLVMPLCISRFEWDIMEANGYENNVIAFGGLEPGPTSCQANSSSAANVVDLDLDNLPGIPVDSQLPSAPDGSLPNVSPDPPLPNVPAEPTSDPQLPNSQDSAQPSPPGSEHHDSSIIDLMDIIYAALKKSGHLDMSIGAQGSPHGDFKDDPLWFTLFVLLFRLPPGSDMGAFLWMRSAIYLRETDQYILFTSFKAQDIHTGSAPTYIKKLMEAFVSMEVANQLFKRFSSQVRVGYVMYPSRAATTHSVQLQYTPSLHFLHSPADPRDKQRKYYIPHGDTIMGDSRARANRLAREGVYALKNYFLQCRINFGLNVNNLLENATYVDESGSIQRLEPTPIDVDDEEVYQMLSLYRRFYFWWMRVISLYSLGVTKPLFKERQKQIKEELEGTLQGRKGVPTERNLLRRPHKSVSRCDPVPRIERIISRRQHGAQGIWTIVLEGNSHEVQYTELTIEKLRSDYNDEKFKSYLKEHGTGPPKLSPAKANQPASANTAENAQPASMAKVARSMVATVDSAAESSQPASTDTVPAVDSATDANSSRPGGVADDNRIVSDTPASDRPVGGSEQPPISTVLSSGANPVSNPIFGNNNVPRFCSSLFCS
ncbi:hypothetical protein MVEN_02253900 [Mycena venus]|uniref:Uncharacterized protein n=1 Tax=Mycena venus TaxID=2733690 RepID=A0A8H7CGG1_9AGAR|nr:hypothetical protein MVEN_02253900 [Mycena venus]